MELTEEIKALLWNTAKDLKGSARRMFMARTVQALGEGGQRLAERELGWNRQTIRKGTQEVQQGLACIDGFRLRGRKRSEDHLPNLLGDLTAIVDAREPGRPAVAHHASLHATDGRRSAPPTDRPKGV